MCWNKFNAADDEEDIEVGHAGEAELDEIPTGKHPSDSVISGNHGRRCGRGRHGRPWPCEWDVGREPDRDERSEPPTAAPLPGAIQTPEKCKTIMAIRPFSVSGRRHALNHKILSHK